MSGPHEAAASAMLDGHGGGKTKRAARQARLKADVEQVNSHRLSAIEVDTLLEGLFFEFADAELKQSSPADCIQSALRHIEHNHPDEFTREEALLILEAVARVASGHDDD